ncbi:hypothetical protein ACFZC5_32890 [Nocardia gamkensis]|uniref:hypothetical protein n=1 Tax=Nocardia gamkensis TaxID=352869 RepID=UPI0036E7E554
MDSFRAVVIRESLRGGQLPADVPATGAREYPHLLDEATPIHIIEVPVEQAAALDVAMRLAEVLLPEKYYAHLVRDTDMLIAFPDTLVRLRVGDEPGERQVQAIGRTFAIPNEQMRFLEMFDVDHPDAPVRAAQ